MVDYKDQNGVRAQETYKTKAEAKERETDLRKEIKDRRHIIPSKSITVSEAGEEWLRTVEIVRKREASTLRAYRYHFYIYIKPHLGDRKLAQLTRADVARFRDRLLSEPLSPNGSVSRDLANRILKSLSSILMEAVDRERVPVNVAARVKVDQSNRDRKTAVVPKRQHIRAILTKLDELAEQDCAPGATPKNLIEAKAWRKRRAFLATAIFTGLRASELRGLYWDCVDLERARVRVERRADELCEIGPPKSASAYRTLSISDYLVSLLRNWKLECPPGDLVFPSEEGRPQSLANIYNRVWRPIQLKAGITEPQRDEQGRVVLDAKGEPIQRPLYKFHSLRHFYASMLIEDDPNMKRVQAAMGHSDIQMTFNTYGHLFEDEDAERKQRERAERLYDSLSPNRRAT